MRLVNHGGRAGVLVDDGIVDVHEATDGAFGPDVRSVLDSWTEFVRVAPDAVARGTAAMPVEPLSAPVPEPRQIFAIGLNYRDHAEETGSAIPEHPVVFTKFASSLSGPETSVRLSSDHVDFEAELVVVIGQGGRGISADHAWEHVAGLMVGQDVSDREVQTRGVPAQWSLGKSFPGYAPTGPAMVTIDELADASDLKIECRVGDEVLQSSTTANLIFTVPEIIAYLSGVLTLLPGDLIFTGTPAGIGITRQPPRTLRPGEVLTTRIDGLGELRTTFTD